MLDIPDHVPAQWIPGDDTVLPLELTMTGNDPTTGLMDQLAAYREQVTRLDTREAEHHTALSRQLAELTDLITAASIGRTLQDFAAYPSPPAHRSKPSRSRTRRYHPGPAPTWWKLPADSRHEPVARLRAWVEQVYRPGYGHLAASLGPCWPSARPVPVRPGHPGRALVGPLPAAPQPRPGVRPGRIPRPHPARPGRPAPIETNRCGHPRNPAPANGQPWSMP